MSCRIKTGIVFSVWLPFALSGQTVTPVAKPGTVVGIVTNLVSGAPIKKCSVTLERGRYRYVAITDDKGNFIFPDVEPGAGYSIAAHCMGYLRSDESVRKRLTVGSEQRVEDVSVKAAPAGVISGRVVDSDGEPLRGVQVQALQYRYVPAGRRLVSVADAVSDALGRYRLHSLAPGRYYVRAYLRVTPPGPTGLPEHTHNTTTDEGLLPGWNPGVPESPSAGALNVRVATEIYNADIQLVRSPLFRISGSLVTNPDQHVRVVAAHCSTGEPETSDTIRADSLPNGAFVLGSLPPGQYCLAAVDSDWRQLAPYTIVRVSNRNIDGLILDAPVAVSYEGFVEVDGAAAPQAPTLRIFVQGASQSSCCADIPTVKSDGSFATRVLEYGLYAVALAAFPPGYYMKYVQLGEQVLNGNLITARPGAGKLKMVLGANAAQVQGKVLDSVSDSGVMVTIAPKDNNLAGRLDLIRSVRSAPDGSFGFQNLAPGELVAAEYYVFAWEDFDEQAVASPSYLQRFTSRAASIAVRARETVPVEVKLIPREEVENARWSEQ